jgi:hypothetical protein
MLLAYHGKDAAECVDREMTAASFSRCSCSAVEGFWIYDRCTNVLISGAEGLWIDGRCTNVPMWLSKNGTRELFGMRADGTGGSDITRPRPAQLIMVVTRLVYHQSFFKFFCHFIIFNLVLICPSRVTHNRSV